MPCCLVLRHSAREGLGFFEETLRERFGTVQYIDAYRRMSDGMLVDEIETKEVQTDIAQVELVVSLGGPMAAYDANSPSLKRELKLLRTRIVKSKPTLGLGLGAQLMAAAMGSRVFPSTRAEIGWYPIRLASEMAIHPVLKLIVEGSDFFFHWHGDTFELPGGSRLIGSSDIFKNQGFIIGRHALGLQFHPQIDAPTLETWLADGSASLRTRRPGVMNPEEMREGLLAHGDSLRRRSQAFLARWLDELWP